MSKTGGYVARMDSANAMSSAPIALFKLPKAPDLPKLSDPKPLPRIVPGYDMRTLRKQLDTLHVEIRERTEQHQNVYSQNEQLWDYIRKLLEYNKTNASTMKGHINTLNNELSILHAERRDLAAKLHEAKHYRQVRYTLHYLLTICSPYHLLKRRELLWMLSCIKHSSYNRRRKICSHGNSYLIILCGFILCTEHMRITIASKTLSSPK